MTSSSNAPVAQRLEISLSSLSQLFNSMDPSPFYERDLDPRAEHYLVSWAQELSASEPLELLIHLRGEPVTAEAEARTREGLSRYFEERGRLISLQLRELLRQGRASLAIGVSFLFLCLSLGSLLVPAPAGSLAELANHGLTIVGWVAMWRPLEVYLYDWWPLRNQIRLYRRLHQMPVILIEATVDAMHSAPVPAANAPGPRAAPAPTRTPAP